VSAAVLHRLDLVARGALPTLLGLFLVLASVVPLHLPHLFSLGAALALISVFFWTLHAPTLMPAPAVFMIGLACDFFGGAPFGLGVLLLLLTHWLLLSQRRLLLGASFLVAWWGFMVVAAAVTLAGWLGSCMLVGAVIDPAPALFSYLLSLCLYPAVAGLLTLLHRTVLRGL
jgi:rod shape-determining protein MreD